MALLNQTQQAYYDSGVFGNYQFTSLRDIIEQFVTVYVGEDKIISKAKRIDVAFHAQRAMQELSFDTFKSCKAQEVTVPGTLQVPLPQDYVNYTKISWVDSAGIKHLMYPTSKTSNPENPFQNSDGDFKLVAKGVLNTASSAIALDSEYLNIEIGMLVTGTYIPAGTFVRRTTNAAGITTIGLMDATGVIAFPTFSGSEIVLQFTKTTGDLVKDTFSSYVVELVDFNILDFKITATNASDFDNIKVGMLVSNGVFPQGTTVVNVDKTTGVLVVDNLPSSASGGFVAEVTFISQESESQTWQNYKSSTPSENNDDYEDDTYWPAEGKRYGLDPQHAQANGSFYIDCNSGKIHFSSNVSGKTVVIDYISDSLGTDAEMQVHKFAEEAMYKWITHGILATRANTPEYLVQRFKKERFAAIRTAKLRLSNIKLEEITQILRGKSKQIKH